MEKVERLLIKWEILSVVPRKRPICVDTHGKTCFCIIPINKAVKAEANSTLSYGLVLRTFLSATKECLVSLNFR